MQQLPPVFQSDLTNLRRERRDKRRFSSDLGSSAVWQGDLDTVLHSFFVSLNRLWQLIWSDQAETCSAAQTYFQTANHASPTDRRFNKAEGFAGLGRLTLSQTQVDATTCCDLEDSAPCAERAQRRDQRAACCAIR